ncbi:MAG: MerR family transcriptional regulator, partial [Anaerolineae bacterium]
MNPFDTNPTFNLKVALQETGIKADTLRAWERRYGLPMPERTPGGHRLYSQYDLETIKWLLARQGEGLSISKAVKLWRSLKQEGTEPLTAREYATTVTAVSSIPPGAPITDMRQAWIAACMNFEEAAAEQVLSQAFAMYPAQMVVLEILQKGLAQVGSDWYENKTTVQQEHFASALALRRLHALVAAAPAPTHTGKILIGCSPGEQHTFPPLLLTLLLRYQGWEALYLGADVPIAEMAETVTAVSPRLVILTAQQIHTAANLLHMARFLSGIDVPLA